MTKTTERGHIMDSDQGKLGVDAGVAFMREYAKKIGVTAECICHHCIRELDLKHPQMPQLPLSSAIMVLCPKCGNKRCPRASDHRLECSGSNDTGQAGSIYA